MALLEGHLDPSELPLREEEDIYSHDTTGYNVRACVRAVDAAS